MGEPVPSCDCCGRPLKLLPVSNNRGTSSMRLSAPSFGVFVLAVVLAGLGVASLYTPIPLVGEHRFWFVVAGFGVLAVGNLFRGV